MYSGETTFEERVHRAVVTTDDARAGLAGAMGVIEEELAITGTLLYTIEPGGRIRPLGGTLQAAFAGEPDWLADDPCLQRSRAMPGPLVHATRTVPWRSFEASAAFREFYDRRAVHHVVCLRLCAGVPMTPGTVGLFLGRTASDFSDRHKAMLRALLPTLSALHRDERRERRLRALLDGIAAAGEDLGRLFVFAPHGELVWATDAARELLAGCGVAKRGAFDRAAREAAGELTDTGRSRSARPFELDEPLALELTRLAVDGGEPLLVGRLRRVEEPEARVAARHRLTPAESAVLGCLGEGMSNREIADALSMAVATVATHVKRLLAKMNMSSRLQAGLAIQRARLMDERPQA